MLCGGESGGGSIGGGVGLEDKWGKDFAAMKTQLVDHQRKKFGN
jgi:hypothetical protein